MNNKDRMILEKMIDYCDQIEQAGMIFGNTHASFAGNRVYQNACCMCLLQIGELAGKLTEEAKAETRPIPWQAIRGMRNLCAHNYGAIDIFGTWATITEDLPTLKSKCLEALTQKP